nr:cytidylate kinase-like family protein [Propionibacterium sp.]
MSETRSNLPLVITLWETYGANMQEVATKLSEELGLKVHKQAFSSEEIEESVQSREKQGIVAQMMRGFARAFPSETSDPSPTLAAEERSYSQLAEENTAIVAQEAAEGGIILGRNGQFLLQNRPNTLHVKLDGPRQKRIERAAALSGISVERAAKRQEIEDEFRADMSMRTYRFDPRDNDYYDLVLNGVGLDTDTIVDLIKRAIQAKAA